MGFECPERKGVADFLQEVTSKNDQQVWISCALLGHAHVHACPDACGFAIRCQVVCWHGLLHLPRLQGCDWAASPGCVPVLEDMQILLQEHMNSCTPARPKQGASSAAGILGITELVLAPACHQHACTWILRSQTEVVQTACIRHMMQPDWHASGPSAGRQ